MLRDLDGLSYRKIAEVVGMPMGTVMSTLFRARERFREAANDGVSDGVSAEDRDDREGLEGDEQRRHARCRPVVGVAVNSGHFGMRDSERRKIRLEERTPAQTSARSGNVALRSPRTPCGREAPSPPTPCRDPLTVAVSEWRLRR